MMVMSYQVLARAYRPRSFVEMVGQEHVVRPLRHALIAGRLHHAYLFCGTRGTGKTTVARVLAKALNCLNLSNGEPCNLCEHCQEVDEGRFVDLMEIDAASRTRVEDTRDLLDNIGYKPVKGRYKIYLIDEVHMLSMHSFNALLKTLEEPPEHVKFLLCTTDPQKCPVTVLSRCLQFYLRHLTIREIVDHLAHILSVQTITFEVEALKVIAESAKGSMRDALSLLDQAINFGAGTVQKTDVLQMVGAIDAEEVLKLLACVIRGDLPGVFNFLKYFQMKSDAYDQLCTGLIRAIHDLAVVQLLPNLVVEEMHQRTLKSLAPLIAPHELQLLYQFALIGLRDLPLAPHPQEGFEMLMLRLVAFRPLTLSETEIVLERKTTIQPSQSSVIKTPVIPIASGVSQSVTPIAISTHPASQKNAARPIKETISLVHEKWLALTGEERLRFWKELIETLNLSGIPKQIILHSALTSFSDHMLTLSLPEQYHALLNEAIKNQIIEALRKSFSPSCELEVLVAGREVHSPVKKHAQEQQELQAKAHRLIQEDEHVQFLQQAFGASIVPGSVKATPNLHKQTEGS